jgi:hypothetical protein
MARVNAHGVEVGLPRGWEGEIRRCGDDPNAVLEAAEHAEAPATTSALAAEHDPAGPAADPMLPRVLLHSANFALPADRGDYGSGAVESMGRGHVFVSLIEFDRAAAGSALFAREGIPRRLRPEDFDPDALQRPLPGQGGHQTFFTHAGRAFCLYVVLGSYRMAKMLTPLVNEILETIEIEPRP